MGFYPAFLREAVNDNILPLMGLLANKLPPSAYRWSLLIWQRGEGFKHFGVRRWNHPAVGNKVRIAEQNVIFAAAAGPNSGPVSWSRSFNDGRRYTIKGSFADTEFSWAGRSRPLIPLITALP